MKSTISSVVFFIFLFFGLHALPCTNYLITRGATEDGSVIITYVADSHTLYGELYFTPSREHKDGDMRDLFEWDSGDFLGRIPEVRYSYSVVGFMNEHQVAIGETTFGGRPELKDPTGGIDYGELMFVALERAKTAREAISVMTSLAEEYGYRSGGESFSISDPKEVWLMEMVGKGPSGKGAIWVACKIPDGYVSAHANQSRIRRFPLHDPDTCIYSKDVITFARQKGYFIGKDEEFSFADAYNPLTCESLRFCEIRVWRMFTRVAPSLRLSSDYVKCKDGAEPLPLYVKPDKKLSIKDVMELMRDHFEGTEFDLSKGIGAGPFNLPYRWRPLTWEVDGVKYLNERAVSTQQTGFSFIAQSRSFLPNYIGGVLWFGVDDTASTVYVPMYAGILEPPKPYAVGTGDFNNFSWDSAFWVFNWVAHQAYLRYKDVIVDIRKVQNELEGEFLSKQKEIEEKALKLYKESPASAREFLTHYSAAQAEKTLLRWKKLGEFLFVKYLDGNVRNEHGKVTHPPYPDAWYRAIVKESGDSLKLGKLKNEYVPEEKIIPGGYFHSFEELGEMANNVPRDFPFDKEKLMLIPGKDPCRSPPICCITPMEDANGRLWIEIPKGTKGKCGEPGYLVRVRKEDNRPLFRKLVD